MLHAYYVHTMHFTIICKYTYMYTYIMLLIPWQYLLYKKIRSIFGLQEFSKVIKFRGITLKGSEC